MGEYSVFDPVPGMRQALALGQGIGDHLQQVKSNQTLRDMFASGVDPYSQEGMQQLGSVDPQLAMQAQAQGARIGALQAGARKDNWELSNNRLKALIPQMLQAGEGKDTATKRQILASVYPEIQRVTPGAPSPDFRNMPDSQVEEAWQNAHMLQAHLSGQNPFAAKPVQRPDGKLEYMIQIGSQMVPTGQLAPDDYSFQKNEFGEFVRGNKRAGTMDVVEPGGGMPTQPMPQPSRIGQPPPGVTAPAPAVVPGAAPVNVDISGGITPQVRAALKADMEMHRQGMAPNPAAGTAQVQGGSNAQRSRAFLENYRRGGGQGGGYTTNSPSVSGNPENNSGNLMNKPAIQRKRLESQIDLERQQQLADEEQARREQNIATEQTNKRELQDQSQKNEQANITLRDELETTRGKRQKDAESKINAQRTLELIADAEKTLPGATGSKAGAMRDTMLGAVGIDTEASNRAAQLDIIHGKLVASVDKFGGSQVSNFDVQAYEKAVGDVGNRNKPVGDRLAALQEVKRLQQRILGQQANTGESPKGPAPGKEPPKGLQSAEEIRAAYKAGKMSRDEARQLLQFHGYK